MRYLTSALLSEGPSDDRFLPRLLERGLNSLCATRFEDTVEVADVTVLRHRSGPATIDQMIGLVNRNPRSFAIVFVHRDQGANAERVMREWIGPLVEIWEDRDEQLVTVVPVRETEAWLLADGDAIRRVLGVTWSDDSMSLPPNPCDVEGIQDPKAVLAKIGDRIRRPIGSYFERLGELVSLERLAHVPAYCAWTAATEDALTRMGFHRSPQQGRAARG